MNSEKENGIGRRSSEQLVRVRVREGVGVERCCELESQRDRVGEITAVFIDVDIESSRSLASLY